MIIDLHAFLLQSNHILQKNSLSPKKQIQQKAIVLLQIYKGGIQILNTPITSTSSIQVNL